MLSLIYVSVLSLPIATSLGVELPSLAWDKFNNPPPFLVLPGDPGLLLRVQPQTEGPELVLNQQVFNHFVSFAGCLQRKPYGLALAESSMCAVW